MDTTPGRDTPEPDRPEAAPRWVLVVGVTAIVLGFLWLLWSWAGSGSL